MPRQRDRKGRLMAPQRASKGSSWDSPLNLLFLSLQFVVRDQGPEQICTQAIQGGSHSPHPFSGSPEAPHRASSETLKPLVLRIASVLLPQDKVLLAFRMPDVVVRRKMSPQKEVALLGSVVFLE